MESIQMTERVKFMKENIDKFTWKEMSEQLGISDRYLRKIAAKNNIHKTLKSLTETDLQYIRENVNKKTWKFMANKFQYSESALIALCKRNGIAKDTDRKLTNAEIESLRKNINLKSWPELAQMFGFSRTYLSDFCKANNIVKEKWSHEKIKKRIETTRTFNKNWLIEGGGLNSKNRWLLQKWKNHNGELPKKHLLVFENSLGTFEDLILIPKKSYGSFYKKRNVRLREKSWAKSQSTDNTKYKSISLGDVASSEREFNRVPVKINHKTVKFVDINKCERDQSGAWHIKTETND
jgi:AraC-like DNA-binding protein